MRNLYAAALLFSLSASGWAADIAADKHMGVATCASSVCHGKGSPQPDQTVRLNEFRTWSIRDYHSRAYQTLHNEDSKRMARNLGLKNAHTAKICLDCHADNVPTDKRGPKFQISDGVGCEACHGGSERWLESHTEPGVTHADNLAAGMYPTEDPVQRAQMCLDCHMGTADQFTTHRIMGAGHPRLRFELESSTSLQPAHYDVDEDYIRRKGDVSKFNLWLSGQVESASRYLALVQSQLLSNAGIAPEFSLYDCHSCHHPMQDQRWSSIRRNQGLQPGGLRLADHHLMMLRAVAGALGGDSAGQLDAHIARLLRGGQDSYAATRSAAETLSRWIEAQRSEWLSRTYSDAEIRSVRRAIARQAADGLLNDYAAAEQAIIAMDSMSIMLGDDGELSRTLDALLDTLESEIAYSPAKFRAASKAALARM